MMVKRHIREIYRKPISATGFPKRIKIIFDKEEYTYHLMEMEDEKLRLRYGANPHQPAALYVPETIEREFSKIKILKYAKGGLSASNVEDGYRAMRVVSYFSKQLTVSIMKHFNPIGVAIALDEEESTDTVFKKAWNCDPRAAFGCVVGFNREVNEDVADDIIKTKKYVECIFAPRYSQKALEGFKEKKSLRIVQAPLIKLSHSINPPATYFPYKIEIFEDTILLERPFYTKIRSLEDLKKLNENAETGVVTDREPTTQEMRDMLHAWWVCCEKRSNGIVIWKRDRTLAVGVGQQDRIGAIEVALQRAKLFGHDLNGSVIASDGFMLKDNVEPLAKVGVTAIIQPGGSISDPEIIKKCNEKGITMIFTGERVFRHF